MCFFLHQSSYARSSSTIKQLRVYNMDPTPILLIECSGIDLFGDSRNSMITQMYDENGKITAREYGEGDNMSLNTWGDSIHIKYPIIIKWAYVSNPNEIKETQFNQVTNLQKGQKKIQDEGSVNLVFHNGKFSLIWIGGKRTLYAEDYIKIFKESNTSKTEDSGCNS